MCTQLKIKQERKNKIKQRKKNPANSRKERK